MSSLQQIQESYLVALDKEGLGLYQKMRDAELDWITATGFEHHDFGNRTHLLVTSPERLELPDISELAATRLEFSAWIKERIDGRPQTIGDRSTALPVWITPDGRIPVDVTPYAYDPFTRIKVRSQTAWRGAANLGQTQVFALFDYWLTTLDGTIARHKADRHQARAGEAIARKSELEKQREQVKAVYAEHGGQLSARLFTGQQLKFRMVSSSDALTTSIATVAIVIAKKAKIEVVKERQRNSHGSSIEVARIGKLAFFKVVS